jgi:antitoxin (DNA-binding transcriptional repressor) of toxin-antitoxin stability system
MKTLDLSAVAALVPHLQSDAQEAVFLTKDGHTVAAVVPADDDNVESLLLSVNPQFQAILERSQKRLESEGGLFTDEVRQCLGLPPKNNA